VGPHGASIFGLLYENYSVDSVAGSPEPVAETNFDLTQDPTNQMSTTAVGDEESVVANHPLDRQTITGVGHQSISAADYNPDDDRRIDNERQTRNRSMVFETHPLQTPNLEQSLQTGRKQPVGTETRVMMTAMMMMMMTMMICLPLILLRRKPRRRKLQRGSIPKTLRTHLLRFCLYVPQHHFHRKKKIPVHNPDRCEANYQSTSRR
jgi:hypothetical protein